MKISRPSGELFGSKQEIRRFKRAMFIWKHRARFLILLEMLCCIPIIFSLLGLLPVFIMFLLIGGTKPEQLGIFRYFKNIILVEGMRVSVPHDFVLYIDGEHKTFATGLYRIYDRKTNRHMVYINGRERYYDFEDINPHYYRANRH